jgi:hypothetical protein
VRDRERERDNSSSPTMLDDAFDNFMGAANLAERKVPKNRFLLHTYTIYFVQFHKLKSFYICLEVVSIIIYCVKISGWFPKEACSMCNNDYLFNKKKRKTFFTQTLFSEWIKEMDHHECRWRGGSTSDESSL